MRRIHDSQLAPAIGSIFAISALLAAGCAGSPGSSAVPLASAAHSVRTAGSPDSGPWTQPIIIDNRGQAMLLRQSGLRDCWNSNHALPATIQPGADSRRFELWHNTQCADGPLYVEWGASFAEAFSCSLVVSPIGTGFTYGVKNEPQAECRVRETAGKVHLIYQLRK